MGIMVSGYCIGSFQLKLMLKLWCQFIIDQILRLGYLSIIMCLGFSLGSNQKRSDNVDRALHQVVPIHYGMTSCHKTFMKWLNTIILFLSITFIFLSHGSFYPLPISKFFMPTSLRLYRGNHHSMPCRFCLLSRWHIRQ